MKTLMGIVVFFLVGLFAQDGFAGGAVARRRQGAQQKMMVQRQMQAQQQMMIQKQIQARQQMMVQQQVAGKVQGAVQQVAGQVAGRLSGAVVMEMEIPQESVAEVVDLPQMMAALDRSGRAWSLMMDQEAKELVVWKYILRLREQGVLIHKLPDYYSVLIDSMSREAPGMLDQPFEQVLQVLAVMEYDLDNGQDKDAMALKVLGSREAVLQNRARLGIQ